MLNPARDRAMFPLPAAYFRQPLPPVIGATVSEYLWADLTPFGPSAALLSVELVYPIWRVDAALPPFRLRTASVSGFPRLWLNSRMPCGCSFCIPVSNREPAGSPKFLNASRHACHALRWTPAVPRGPHHVLSVRLCWLPMPLKTSPSALNAMTGLYQALESTVSPAACMFPCVRFN